MDDYNKDMPRNGYILGNNSEDHVLWVNLSSNLCDGGDFSALWPTVRPLFSNYNSMYYKYVVKTCNTYSGICITIYI